MYRFTYFDDRVKLMLQDKKAFLDPELEQELCPVLKILKQTGEVEGAVCGQKPGVNGLVYELKGRTFFITYAVDSNRKEIRFYEFHQVSHSIDWKTALEQDLYHGEEQIICIPQIGDPHKFITAIDLIHAGANTSKTLAIEFGSPATKDIYLARRGDYLVKPLIEFGLATRERVTGQSSSLYVLTDRGQRIAESSDRETRERLLVEALLGFYPIQVILEETTSGGKELTKELIQDVISRITLGDCGGTTNPRRASSLRALVNWVSRWAGIPVQRSSQYVQLYIPYIYAS